MQKLENLKMKMAKWVCLCSFLCNLNLKQLTTWSLLICNVASYWPKIVPALFLNQNPKLIEKVSRKPEKPCNNTLDFRVLGKQSGLPIVLSRC